MRYLLRHLTSAQDCVQLFKMRCHAIRYEGLQLELAEHLPIKMRSGHTNGSGERLDIYPAETPGTLPELVPPAEVIFRVPILQRMPSAVVVSS